MFSKLTAILAIVSLSSATQTTFDLRQGVKTNTVWDLIKTETCFSEFAKAAGKFPRIVEQLSGSKYQHTILVPRNEAFKNIYVRGKDLEQVLDYHIINGRKTGAILGDVQMPGNKALFATHTSPQSLKGRLQLIELFYCSWADAYYVGHYGRAAKIVPGSLQTGSNGVIYQIEKVLFPPGPLIQTLANVEPYATKASLSTFVSALEISGMSSGPTYLNDMSGITVFAPSNEAWRRLGSRMVRFLMSPMGAKVLRKIMEYHVVPGQVAYSNRIPEGFTSMATLLPGKSLSITERRTSQGRGQRTSLDSNSLMRNLIMVNHNARVITSDILTENGVAHVIDSVLLPCDVSFEEMMETGNVC